MAKDAGGHGSEKRGGPGSYTGAFKGGGSIGAMMENAPKGGPGRYTGMFKGGGSIGAMEEQAKALDASHAAERGELGSAHSSNSGEAHVASIAAQHGVPTGHLSNFPITLIGDKGHAAAQQATVDRLTRRGAAQRSK